MCVVKLDFHYIFQDVNLKSLIIWLIISFTRAVFVCILSGLVPFAVGSETAGSMTYPAARCGVTAIRPTFGMVGRTGVMSLSESLV